MVGAGKGVDLAIVAFVLYIVEDALEHLYAFRVADEQYIVGQGVCGEVDVVEAAVGSQW